MIVAFWIISIFVKKNGLKIFRIFYFMKISSITTILTIWKNIVIGEYQLKMIIVVNITDLRLNYFQLISHLSQ